MAPLPCAAPLALGPCPLMPVQIAQGWAPMYPHVVLKWEMQVPHSHLAVRVHTLSMCHLSLGVLWVLGEAALHISHCDSKQPFSFHG